MFVKQEQNTLVIIQYIACGGEPCEGELKVYF